jgi:protein-S-isoprenylcysteine O-methyltransferase Ste14
MSIDALLLCAGVISALLLMAGLIGGIVAGKGQSPRLRRWQIWPAPPVGSLKSFLFWTLFRTLNIVVLALALKRLVPPLLADTLTPIRLALAMLSLAAGGFYAYALWALGRKATYCQASGLATGGVYRWSRNPQYATAIAAFATLGLAADAPDATPLAAALVAVYALMAIAEEAWLEARYGRVYLDYRAEVPRFFGLRHAGRELASLLARKSPRLANGPRDER